MDETDSIGIDPDRSDDRSGVRGAAPERPGEEAHWREHHRRVLQQENGHDFEAYRPAYELGLRRGLQRNGAEPSFEQQESELAREWEAQRGASPLDWPAARAASRMAWDRADELSYEQAKQVGMTEAFAFIDAGDDGPGAPPMSRPAPLQPAAPTSVAAGPAIDDETLVALLNPLLENAHDGEHGYRECAQAALATPELKNLFDECANWYQTVAGTLSAWVLRYGGTPATGGTLLGAAQRGWTHVKTALGADTAQALLEQCERAEDVSIDRYRSVLQQRQGLPTDVRTQIEQQSAAVRRQHERIRQLRNAGDNSVGEAG